MCAATGSRVASALPVVCLSGLAQPPQKSFAFLPPAPEWIRISGWHNHANSKSPRSLSAAGVLCGVGNSSRKLEPRPGHPTGRGLGNPPSSASKLFLVMRAPLVKRGGAIEVPPGTRARLISPSRGDPPKHGNAQRRHRGIAVPS
jgi:hypothetical protein